ncbi:MAG: YraN family protein [Nitrospirae bacterium]|nr:YraN family protein [Fimbriimonadaceae bacterium]
MPQPRSVGTNAEDRAAEHLLAKGLTLLTRRFKSGRGEIDLIALDGERLVFVEVKARRNPDDALSSVTPAKIQRLVDAAARYAESAGLDHEWRFDVVVVCPDAIHHYPDAFQAW